MVTHSKAPAEMKYPVQDTTHKSSFAPAAEKKPPVPPSLHGPKFKSVDREHGFTGLEKDLDMDESEVEMANKMKRQGTILVWSQIYKYTWFFQLGNVNI